MTSISDKELDRQYRLVHQTRAMHYSLSDSYDKKRIVSELLLLVASIIFLVTTFAGKDFYEMLSISEKTAKFSLGIASVVGFTASLILLLLKWSEKGAEHRQAGQEWSIVLAQFRNSKNNKNEWIESKRDELSNSYIAVSQNSIEIPDKKFNQLKAQYLLKKEMSKAISLHPGTFRIILWLRIRFLSSYKAIFK